VITGGQVRAARGLLGWSQAVLAEKSEVGLSTVRRMEADLGPVRVYSDNLWKVQRALEAAGIRFIDQDDGGGAGVRLHNRESY
jgi:transcriptional regulator with XRE-family HTH domain